MSTKISITGLSYSLGDLKCIEELEYFKKDPEKINIFLKAGLQHYSEYKSSIIDLAFESALKTIETSNIKKENIQLLLFVYENYGKDYILHMQDLNRLVNKLGIINAFPIGITLSDCANIVTGLNTAYAFSLANRAENILMISVDKISEHIKDRIMTPEMSILSDAAVSCIISNKEKGTFQISAIFGKNFPEQWTLDRKSEMTTYSTNKFKNLIQVTKQARTEIDCKAEDFKYFISSNYLTHISKMFVQMCGFKEKQVFFNNIPRFGHTIAGDVLINLKDLDDTGELISGDKIMLMSDSYSSCSAVCLIKL